MQNTNALLEKLMLNRAALMMKKFDKELKEALHTELQNLKPNNFRTSDMNADKRLVA